MGKRRGLEAQLEAQVKWLGWLAAVPDHPEKHKGPRDNRTRGERYKQAGGEPDELEPPLPFHPDLQSVVELLYEVGPTSPGGEVIGWPDITAWLAATGREIEPWLLLYLRRLSAVFINERHAAKNPLRPKPEVVLDERRDVELSPAAASSLNYFMQMAAADQAAREAAEPEVAPEPPPVRKRRARAKARPRA